jgi:pilus assembly protein CpaC
MYDQTESLALTRSGFLAGLLLVGIAVIPLEGRAQHYSDGFESPKIIRRISQESERLELTTNSSRILTLDKQIPRVQVNNPELLAVTPLSATQVQISAKKPGVTQVNLWDEDKQVHTIDVVIYGDLRELEFALKTQFPNSSVKVRKYSQSLLLTGYVDSPDHVVPISQLAEDYAPKVITNMQVGGVQQVLLKVKVFEVSRTKLRALGSDFAGQFGDFHIASSVSGIIGEVAINPLSVTASGQTIQYGVVGSDATFFGFLDALQQNNVAKILAEPNIVSVSGRPAQFLEGGELPILVPQSLGTSSIEFKPFGTQVDFLPIVLGNGNIRLEVRPRVSALDPSIGIQLQDQNIPGFRVRQADTAVEMRAGQTFALAGLLQHQTEGIKRGIPYLSDLPVLGVPFRRTEERVNEIELLILVTPEFVDALDPSEVPTCGPGMGTRSPSNSELYCDGFLEVPTNCGPCANGNCGPMGQYHGPAGTCHCDQCMQGQRMPMGHGVPMEHHHSGQPLLMEPAYGEPHLAPPTEDAGPVHGELRMPTLPSERLPAGTEGATSHGAGMGARGPAGSPGFASRPQPNFRRQATPSAPPQVPAPRPSGYAVEQGLIGPIGYDVDE